MAFTIQSSVGTSQAAATGRSTQGHVVYAVNQAAYWVFFLSSTNALSALYSTNSGGAWNTPSGSPFTLANAHNSNGRDFGFAYANLASLDILHMASSYVVSSNDRAYHARFALGSTWTNTNAETQYDTSATDFSSVCSAAVTILDSTGRPVDANSYASVAGSGDQGNGNVSRGTNTDSGTSWTAGYPNATNVTTGAGLNSSNFLASLGSGNLLFVADNEPATNDTFTQLNYSKYTGSWAASAAALASTVTQTPSANWGAVAVSTSDIHVVALSNNNNVFVHRRYNGTSWSNSSGAPANLALSVSAPAGIALVTDGTNVYAATVDNLRAIRINTWTSGGGWAGWQTQESARTNQPAYITGVYNAAKNEIMWTWTETNGTNHDIIGSMQSITSAPNYFPAYNAPRWELEQIEEELAI